MTMTSLRPIDRVLDALRYGGQRTGQSFKCLCPSHDDGKESLSVTEGKDGKVLLHCFAGCTSEAIVAALGLEMTDLFADAPKQKRAKKQELGPIIAQYDYTDETGKMLYQATRHNPKNFRQRQPDGKGGWIWSITNPPVRRVLYHLPELNAAPTNTWVFVVEGEKDVDNLRALGLAATCNAMGAGKWEDAYTDQLEGRNVCILPDNDEPGRAHGALVARSLHGTAASVRVVELPGLPVKGDVSDWLASGGTADQLLALVDASADYIAPVPTQSPSYIYSNGNGAHPPEPPSAPHNFVYFADIPHNTDMGNAQRMHALFKDRLLYVPHFGKWYVWTGTHWREDDNFTVLAMAKQTVLNMYGELSSIADDDKRKEHLKWIVQSESRSRLENMIALLRSEPGISVRPDMLDREAMYLPCRNGTIDLRTGDLLPADPAHRFTKCIDIDYDPGAECPLWDRFLSRIMGGDLELVSFIQRLVGHALTGDAGGKYIAFLWGPKGNNGKSTLAETVMRLLGTYAIKSPSEMVMAKSYRGGVPNDIARLRGVRFTVTNEVDEGMTLSESVVKDLTGKDTLTARFMREEFFDFAPTHKLWIYGNHKPEIRGTDPAIWDRVKLIPFEVEIPEGERDPHLQDKLAKELPGILAWAVRGCLAWQKMGINAPEGVKAATGEYRAEQDMIGQFVDDCCDLDRSYEVASGSIYQAYEAWCKALGIKAETGTKFGSELTRRGFKSARTASLRMRQGLRLNSHGRQLLPDTASKHWTDND